MNRPKQTLRALWYRYLLLKQYRKGQRFAKQHEGNRLLCNFCGYPSDRFMPCGESFSVLEELVVKSAGIREDCRCPNCFSKDRDRLILEFLKLRTHVLDAPARLLHMAPEPRLKTLFERTPQLDYVNADLDPILASEKEDLTHLSFADASFDVVICNHVLEHIPDDRKAMREILRVLKPGGWALLQVPIGRTLEVTREDPSITDPRERERHFGQRDHVRIYGLDYPQRLEQAGFSVKPIEPADFLDAQDIERLAILPEETLYQAFKPLA
ncbi:MAG: class I SAM-dependent methyltransferase [Leptolyngbya sp. SIO3F4]|nr:class I SAM-dependent methyltransferase [Leptolyngbya sp. SIO3F4]